MPALPVPSGLPEEEALAEHREVDVSSLRTAASGECVETAPSSAVRCTISVRRTELQRIVFRVHVLNDTDERVRCTPGTRRGSHAIFQEAAEIVCDPRAEVGFVFSVPRLGQGRRYAFVRVSGAAFACGFDEPIQEDALPLVAIALGTAALVLVVAGGLVLYDRSRKRTKAPPAAPQAPAQEERVVEETSFPASVDSEDTAPVQPQEARAMVARGFAAAFDEQRVVMGALEVMRQNLFSCDFVAKVVNQTKEPLLCTVSGRTQRAMVSVAPGTFAVHAQSAAAVAVTAPLRIPWRLRSLDLRMESSTLSASARADVPVPLGARIASWIVAATCAVLVAIGLSGAMHPRITAFTAPTQVLAGDPFTANYDLAGWGSGRYTIFSGSNRVAGGPLNAKHGTLTFFSASRPARYTIVLGMAGPLGGAQKIVSVDAIPRRVALAPAIGSLAVDPSVVASRDMLSVRYSASADSGSVSLIDASGIAVERAPYVVGGITSMRAPTVTTPTQYDVMLDVSRGGAVSHASVGLLVLPQALATPQPLPQPPAGVGSAAQLVRIPSHVVGGRLFTVAILAHPAGLVLTLASTSGSVIVSEPVAAAASSEQMLAPGVGARTRFVLLARFRSGTADQVLLAPLEVYPR